MCFLFVLWFVLHSWKKTTYWCTSLTLGMLAHCEIKLMRCQEIKSFQKTSQYITEWRAHIPREKIHIRKWDTFSSKIAFDYYFLFSHEYILRQTYLKFSESQDGGAKCAQFRRDATTLFNQSRTIPWSTKTSIVNHSLNEQREFTTLTNK